MAKNIMKRTLAGTLAVLTVAGAVPANTFVGEVFAKTAISASAAEYGISDFENLKTISKGDTLTCAATSSDSVKQDMVVVLINETGGISGYLAEGATTWTANDNYVIDSYKKYNFKDEILYRFEVKIKSGLWGAGTKADPYQIGSLDDFNKYLNEDKYTNADGAYIKLTGDFEITTDATITKNTILDFAGHTISGEYGLGVAKGVSVTVDDSQNGSGGMPWLLWNEGELTVNNGNFGNIQAMDGATQTTVKGGKFESILIYSGNADIEGGTVDSRYYPVLVANANSIVNISGGDFNGSVYCEKGVLNITGGTFTGEAFGQGSNAVLTISGGTFNVQWVNLNADKPVVITGGTFTGTPFDDSENKLFELRGGTFSFDPSADEYKAHITIPNDYEAVKTGENEWTVQSAVLQGKGTKESPYLIGSLNDFNKYLNEDKYTNADGAYIKLTSDFKSNENINITKNTFLDFAGHQIQNSDSLIPSIDVYAELTVDDSADGDVINIESLTNYSGKLTINGGSYKNVRAELFNDTAPETIFNDGKIGIMQAKGTVDINGGTFTQPYYYNLVVMDETASVNISGGTFNGYVDLEVAEASISGGEFKDIFYCGNKCITIISGGTFNGKWANLNADNPAVITGGTFKGTPSYDSDNKMFELRGGTFSFDPSADEYKANIIIPDDRQVVQTGESEWTVEEKGLSGAGTKADPYLIGSLNDFNKYLNGDEYTNADGAYIKLTGDFEITGDTTITKNTILDFAGHTMSGEYSLVVGEGVSVTVDDSQNGSGGVPWVLGNKGELTVNNGNFGNIQAMDGATQTTVKDGEFENIIIFSGNADIEGGTVGSRFYSLSVENADSIVNISGGDFNRNVCCEKGVLNITGGTFNQPVKNNYGTMNITGGTFNQPVTNNYGTMNITGGTFNETVSNYSGTVNITGGTFSSDPSGFENVTIPNDYKVVQTGENEWTVEEKGISGEGTEQSPYIISNAKQWELFAKNVNSGVNADAFYKLSDDFDNTDTPVTVMVGTSENPFTGTLDGNGKTLNVDIRRETAEPATAPFSHIGGGAVIKNLNVAGSVKGAKHSSGLVGYVNGNTEEERCYIENCTSSADVEAIVTSIESRHVGGIVGHAGISYLTVKNVTFSGTLKNDSTYAGGIIGWSGSCTYTLDNCLFTGKYLGEGLFHPIALKFYNEKANATVNDCYYTEDFTINSDSRYIAVKGTKVFKEVPKGIKYTTVTAADGNDYYYNFDYTVKDVSYYDSVDGETKTVEEATAVSSIDTEWKDGTYAVTESFSIDNKITVNGDVKLIVPEGKILNLNKGICIEENSTLTVYSTKSKFLDGMIAVKDLSTDPENATIYGKGTFCNNGANIGILKNAVNAVNCGKLVTRGGRLAILYDNEESSICTTTEFIDPSVEYDLTGGYTSFDPRMQLDIDYNATHDGTFWHIEARERIKLSDLEELTFYNKDLLLDIDEDCEILIHDGEIAEPQKYTKGDKLLIYKNMLLTYIDTEAENLTLVFYTIDDEGFEADDSNKYTNTNHGKNDTAAYMQYTADEDKSVKWQVSSDEYDDLLFFVNDEFMIGASEEENGFFNIKKGDDVKIVFLKDSVDGEEVYDDLASIEFVDTIKLTYVDRKEPTCTENGYLGHYVDGDGNKYTEYDVNFYIAVSDESITLEATDHDWGDVNVVFSDDFSQATATRICKNDETHIETETVDTSYKVTTYPTCTEKGVKTYTAEFKNPAFGTQTAYVNIAPTGHTYNARPTWTWNGHESAVATFTCIEDDSELPLTAIVTSETTEPKVGVKGKTVYTATVGFQNKKYTNTVVEWIPAITVTKIEAIAPTHFKSGMKEYYAGSDDKFYILEDGEYVQIKTLSDLANLFIDPIPHTFGDPVWKWDEDNNAKAEFTCTEDDYVDTFIADVTSETIDPTYTTEGKIVYTATVVVYDKTYTDTKEVAIDKIALTHVEAVEPTTAKEGNSEYWFDEAAGKYFADAEGKNEITLEDTVIAKLPAQVKPTYQAGDGCVKLTWDAVEGAEKYAVCGYVSGNWKLIEEGAGTSYVLNGLTSGNEYKVAVIAKVNGAWERDFSNAITVSPKIEDIEFPELTVGVQNNKFVLNWTEVKGAEKYGIAVYISGKWKVQAYTDANVTTFTSPKLKTGSSYKILVCAKVNGKWDLRDINKRFVTSTIV